MLNNYSGISYNISIPNGAIPYAQKITTVNDSDYNLIDAHRIDWNSSKLSYIAFKSKYIEKFFGVPDGTPQQEKANKRLRYGDTPNYNSSGIPTSWPNWYEGGNYQGYINNTGELLDIIDYLSYSTNYLCEAIERLQDSFNKTKPILKLLPDEITALNGAIDINSNDVLSKPIKFYLEPNQNNADFIGKNNEKAYNEDKYKIDKDNRRFVIHTNVIDQTGNNITSDLELFYKGNDNKDFTDVFSVDGNGLSLSYYAPLLTESRDGLTGQYLTEYKVDGWKPLLTYKEIDPKIDYANDPAYMQYSNYLLSTITAKTPPTSQHSPSDPLTIKVQIVKSTNKFDYIYINGVRYIYLERGFFKENSEYNNNNIYCDYIINVKDLGYGVDLENLDEKYFERNDLYKYLVCVSSQLSNITNLNYIKVSNESNVEIKIFPRYFGNYNSGTNKGILPGSIDANDIEDNVASQAKYVLTTNDNYLKNLNTQFTNTITEVIDGKLRTGFKINFNMTVNGDDITSVDKNNRSQGKSPQAAVDLFICTTPTKYVGYNNIFLRFAVIKSYEVFLIDANRDFNETVYDNYETQPKTDLNVIKKPIDTLSKCTNQGVLFSDIERKGPGEYTWDLGISIFNERSWMNNDTRYIEDISKFKQAAEQIYNPNNLISNDATSVEGVNSLPKPNSDVKILEGKAIMSDNNYEFIENESGGFSNYLPNANEYLKGFPKLLIGGRNSFYDPEAKLTYVYVREFINGNYRATNISDNLTIDFKETYRVNKNFIEKLSVNDQNAFNTGTDEDLGKKLCFKYCGMVKKIGSSSNSNIGLELVFFRPTVPSTLFGMNNDKKEWEDYSNRDDWFKLILKIDPKGMDSNSNSSNIIHDGIKITMRLLVSRAESKFSGWAYRQAANGTSTINIMLFDKETPKSSIVSSNPFLKNNYHCIQTRLNSNFTVTNDYPDTELKATLDGYITHSFTFNQQSGLTSIPKTLWIKQSSDKIILLPNDPDKSENIIENKIDDEAAFQMKVSMSGNQWFKAIKDQTIYTQVYRKPNDHINFTTKAKLLFSNTITDSTGSENDAQFIFNSKYSVGSNYEDTNKPILDGISLYNVLLNNVTMDQLKNGFNLWNFFDNSDNFTNNLKRVYTDIGNTKNIKDIVQTAVTLSYNVGDSLGGINNNYRVSIFTPPLRDYNSFDILTKDSRYNRFYYAADENTDEIDKYVQIIEPTADNGVGEDGLILKLTNKAETTIGASKLLYLTLQIMFPMINNIRGYILDLRITISIK